MYTNGPDCNDGSQSRYVFLIAFGLNENTLSTGCLLDKSTSPNEADLQADCPYNNVYGSVILSFRYIQTPFHRKIT